MSKNEMDANPEQFVLNQRLGSDVVASLDDWQRSAVQEALDEKQWSTKHPLNIRLTFPFIKKRYYLTVVGGQEKRNPQRQVEDRGNHPVRTFINVLFAIGVVSGATVLMLVLLALYSSIIEF